MQEFQLLSMENEETVNHWRSRLGSAIVITDSFGSPKTRRHIKQGIQTMQYLTAAINGCADFQRNELSSGLIQDELIQGWLDAALWCIEVWEKCDRALDQWQALSDDTQELAARWIAPLLPILRAIAFWALITTAQFCGWCWGHTKRWWWMAWYTALEGNPYYFIVAFKISKNNQTFWKQKVLMWNSIFKRFHIFPLND